MFRKLVRSFLPLPRPNALSANPNPHRAPLDFALVLVDAETDEQAQRTVGAVVDAAIAHEGEVLQILGPLVFVAFSRVVGIGGIRKLPMREAFVSQLSSDHKAHVRIVHGCADALVGLVGSKNKWVSYTAILDNFDSILLCLASLKPGEAAERSTLGARSN